MDITKYIIGEALIMIPVIYLLVEFVKSMDLINKKYIPVIALILSLGITPLMLSGTYCADNFIQAILIAGVTVFTHELLEIGEGWND